MAREFFTEKVTARVNDEPESGTHEVIFRGVRSANTLKLVNERGMRQIEDGKTYEIVVREVEARKRNSDPAATETKAEAKAAQPEAAKETGNEAKS